MGNFSLPLSLRPRPRINRFQKNSRTTTLSQCLQAPKNRSQPHRLQLTCTRSKRYVLRVLPSRSPLSVPTAPHLPS